MQKNTASFVCSDCRYSTRPAPHSELVFCFSKFFFFSEVVTIWFLPLYLLNERHSRRAGSGCVYHQCPSNVNAHGCSFLPRITTAWNLLPNEVVKSPTLQNFKLAAMPAMPSFQTPGHLRRQWSRPSHLVLAEQLT